MKKKENKPNHYILAPPTLMKRCWKTWLYNLICVTVTFGLYFAFFTLYDMAYELDYLMTYGVFNIRARLIFCGVTFYFMFRQFFKECNLIKFSHLSRKHDDEIIDYGGYKRMYEGDEGTGKTMAVGYDTLFLACHKDAEMRFKYYLLCPFAEELTEDVDFKVLKENYDLYNSQTDKIPHYMANFDVEYDGRKQYKWSDDYLDKELRLPEGMAVGLTELANILPNAWSRVPKDEENDTHNMLVKTEVLSLTRQLYDAHITGDDQRAGEVALQWRSVVARTYDIIERPKVLAPHFLIMIENKVKNAINKRGEANTKLLTRLYNFLHDLIEDIGFFVYVYNVTDSQTGKVLEENKTFVIPCDIPFKYDTRGQGKKTVLDKNDKPLYENKPDIVSDNVR